MEEKMCLYDARPDEKREAVEENVYDMLEELKIDYVRADHKPLATIAQCNEVDLLFGVKMCKNLFLCNAQKTKFYLLMIREDKKFLTKDISRQINSARLSFAPAEYMEKFLDITPGSVSVLGLMNDTENHVQLLIDADVLKDEYFACHPCINTSSLRMPMHDLTDKLIPAMNHPPRIIDFP